MTTANKPSKHFPASRSITPEILPPEREGHYKASLHVERQIFGNARQQAEQLFLPELGPERSQEVAERVTGLDLTWTEMEALQGLSILLARTGYRGNAPQKIVNTKVLPGEQSAPVLILESWATLFEACGFERGVNGKFSGKKYEALKKAVLKDLPRSRTIAVKTRYRDKKKWRYNVMAGEVSLISTFRAYTGLNEIESKKAERGEKLPDKIKRMAIQFHPVILKDIESFYSQIPTTLFQDIKEILGSQYKGRTAPLLVRYLLTLDIPTIEFSEMKLAQILRLEYLLAPKKPDSGPQAKRFRKELERGILAAQELGFILSHKVNIRNSCRFYWFELNPEKCLRLKNRLAKKGIES